MRLTSSLAADTFCPVSIVDGVAHLWREAPVPEKLAVTRVDGWLICPSTGRVVLLGDGDTWSLPGGSQENFDEDLEDTLIRQAAEGSRLIVRRGRSAYLGYREVRRAGCDPYARVQMVGLIDSFTPKTPDPDRDRRYRRYMTSLAEAPDVLARDESTVLQAEAAARVAREWGFPVDTAAESGYRD